MNIGEHVSCPAANKKGIGVIIDRQNLFQRDYVKVFFPLSRETLTILETELESTKSPEVAFKEQQFSTTQRFLLRLFNQQVKATGTGDGLQAAANFKILPLPHQLLAVKYVLDQ